MYKLVWFERDDGPASTAWADSYTVSEGILVFNAEKPIVLSSKVKFIVK